jgi:hypothetical protein
MTEMSSRERLAALKGEAHDRAAAELYVDEHFARKLLALPPVASQRRCPEAFRSPALILAAIPMTPWTWLGRWTWTVSV